MKPGEMECSVPRESLSQKERNPKRARRDYVNMANLVAEPRDADVLHVLPLANELPKVDSNGRWLEAY